MTFFHFRTKKGFTLVEMVLYVAICSILLLSLSSLLSFLLSSRVRSQSINEVNQQGTQVMYLITQTLRNGRSVQVPLIGATSSTLSVTTSNALLNPTIFSLSSTTLTISEGGKLGIPLTNSRVRVSSLTFQNISSTSTTEKIVKISFVLEYVNKNGKSEYSYTKNFIGSATLR